MKIISPRFLVHIEGGAALILALLFFGRTGGNWLVFAILILAPDLSALGYLVNVRVGSFTYNLFHTYTVPVLLSLAALWFDWPLGLSLALIWFAHIGADRMLGFGLKYPTGFKDHHLQRL